VGRGPLFFPTKGEWAPLNFDPVRLMPTTPQYIAFGNPVGQPAALSARNLHKRQMVDCASLFTPYAPKLLVSEPPVHLYVYMSVMSAWVMFIYICLL
jgi:hypothetical protein